MPPGNADARRLGANYFRGRFGSAVLQFGTDDQSIFMARP